MLRSLSIAALSLALLPACRGGSGRADVWSCENPMKLSCSQWSTLAVNDTTVDDQQQACRAMGGVVADGPCAGSGVVGSCTSPAGNDARIVYYAPRRTSDAQRTCAKLGGVWR